MAEEALRMNQRVGVPTTDLQAMRAEAARLNIAANRLILACIEEGYSP